MAKLWKVDAAARHVRRHLLLLLPSSSPLAKDPAADLEQVEAGRCAMPPRACVATMGCWGYPLSVSSGFYRRMEAGSVFGKIFLDDFHTICVSDAGHMVRALDENRTDVK